MKKIWLGLIFMLAACYGNNKTSTDIYAINSQGEDKKIGVITMQNSPLGLQLSVDITGVPEGEHGFHVHEFGDCGATTDKDGKMTAGLKAGGHYDPDKTGEHLGPQKDGHKGDLPYLTADKNGRIAQTVYAPHLNLSDIKGRALMIHEGGDNYQDKPQALGGGGARIACGVVN